MFEADQFHQFIDSSRTATATPNSLPLSFPNSFHASSSSSSSSSSAAAAAAAAANSAFSTFDSFSINSSSSQHHHHHVSLHPNFLPQTKNQHKEDSTILPMNNLETERDRSIQDWSTDEILTLFRIRSSMDNNCFPEFTWDHVSRKLAEFGFKKSAEKCKEKFEEESRYFNNINTTNFSKNYRVFGEFEDLYHSDNNTNNQNQNPNPQAEKNKKLMDKANQEEEGDKIDQTVVLDQNKGKEGIDEKKSKSTSAKRKREKISSSSSSSCSFEMFKGFCQDIITKIVAQQEHMHNKLLEDMAKRDEEKVAREEEWKKQEMDRIDKELQLRAQQQALSTDRQATIINFLKSFSSNSTIEFRGDKCSNSSTSSPSLQNPKPISSLPNKDSNFSAPKSNPNSNPVGQLPNHQNPNSPFLSSPQNPNSPLLPNSSISTETVSKRGTIITSNEKDDLGKRWPKDEVLALINLRCSLSNSTTNGDDKESQSVKAPLWERISKGMMELGYNRSAKRCKEKWENINKYFRKTKDVNKKRSLDSRTCPYFHQLSTLYNQGKLVVNSSDVGRESAPNTSSTNSTLIHQQQAAEGDEQNLVQTSGFEFEF